MRASERRKQEELLGCYRELQAGGELRAFASALGALPAPEPKVVDAATQQRLTGLAPSAFAPPKSNRFEGAIAGGLLVGGLAVARALEVDPRPFVGVPTALLLADRALLRGLPSEAITRALNPEYRRTVVAHEAGHFLCAYLLGCPVQACLLDPVAALRDGRVNGAAGTVFFDPELGESMEKGSLARSVIDRYCVVVMGGIAAEAERNQQAEGGRSDEAALINLLSSLDGGRTWDIARIQSQARWAASQALLLLREHRAAFDALCAALEAGASVGECILAIEGALDGDDVVRMVEESSLFGPETMDSARKNVRTILGLFEEYWSDVEDNDEDEDPLDYYNAFRSWSDKMDDDNTLAHDSVMLWHYLRTASHNIEYSAVVALTAFVEDILANIIQDAYKQTQQEVALNKKTDWYKALLYTDNQSHTEHPYVLAHGVKTSQWAHEMRTPAWPNVFGGDTDKWGDVRGVDIEDFIGVETCVTRRHIWNAIAQQEDLKAFFTGDVFDANPIVDETKKDDKDDKDDKDGKGGKKQKTA